MALLPFLYSQAAKIFRNEPARVFKDRLRPLKHAIVGKGHIYKAIEVVNELEQKRNRGVRTVFDIGAAIGEATLPFLRDFPEANIYCFEPLPDSFDILLKRTKNYADRIKYFNHGISDSERSVDFYVLKHRDASSIIPQSSPDTKKISINVRRLDDVVKELNIDRIEFMKIDVEGWEKEVTSGAMETLSSRVDNVFIEISPLRKGNHNRDYIDVFENLHKAGFSFA